MRVLVTYGSKRGGTEGIARMLADGLRAEGVEVDLRPAGQTRGASGFDAVIVGGALYANRWHRAARRFVARNVKALRRVPVWFFSSGPLDDSADREEIPPPPQVSVLMERVGAQSHVTFGGFLARDAQGFPASAMAKQHAGDFRNPARIRAWASDLSRAFETARPGIAHEPSARSPLRLLLHGIVAWTISAAAMNVLLWAMGPLMALVLSVLVGPAVFGIVAYHYFRPRGAREPLPTAIVFLVIAVVLDLLYVALLMQQSFAMYRTSATWVRYALLFIVTWAIGAMLSTTPWPRTTPRVSHA